MHALMRFHARVWVHAACVVLCMAVLAPRMHADEQYSEDAVKAAYLYRFAGYVEWPEASLAGRRAFRTYRMRRCCT